MRTAIALNDQGIKKYRLQDYLLFLANVKNIPVGVAPKQSILANSNAPLVGENSTASYDTATTNWNFTVQNAISSNLSSTQTFTIALPIFQD